MDPTAIACGLILHHTKGELRWILTVHVEFHGPAGSSPADSVAGHAAVAPPVLFPHGSDHQRGVVPGEAVSVPEIQRDVVPQPLEHDSRPSLHRTRPGHVCLVLNDSVRRALLNDRSGDGDWGVDKRSYARVHGRHPTDDGDVAGRHPPSTVTCTVLSSLMTSPVSLWNAMLSFRW